MDLFDYMRMENAKKESPLAVRMRPRTLDEVVGAVTYYREGQITLSGDQGG